MLYKTYPLIITLHYKWKKKPSKPKLIDICLPLRHTNFYYIIQMPTTPLFLQIGQVIMQLCSDNNLSVSTLPFSRPLILRMPPPHPTSAPPPHPVALKRKVGGYGLAGRGGCSLQGTVIYLDCYLKSIGDERREGRVGGNHPRKIFQHIRLYNKQITTANKP